MASGVAQPPVSVGTHQGADAPSQALGPGAIVRGATGWSKPFVAANPGWHSGILGESSQNKEVAIPIPIPDNPRNGEDANILAQPMEARRRTWWQMGLVVSRTTLQRFRVVPLLLGALLGLTAAVLVQGGYILLGGNFYEVIPGQVFRSAQPSPESLEQYIQAHGIQTVINLRGDNAEHDWYHQEIAATLRQGATFYDVGLWAHQPPPAGELVRLVDLLENAPKPILVHCYSGADRTGLASALALLLRTDSTLEQARGQLRISFGYFRWSKAGCHLQLLDRYEEWLQEMGRPHSAEQLRYWARHVYDAERIVR